MKKSLFFLVICSLILSSCSPTQSDTMVEKEWWKRSVFYEIFVRSFYDSNGDGIGDFNGLTEKLDYINDGKTDTKTDLGVNAIWLMPIFPTTSYHGYDVTDYYNVNPEFGTLDDFKKLISEAHKRKIRVIIDLVINHTSNEHPWFLESQKKDSKYRDWYIWSEKDPGYIGPWGEKVWHQGGYGGFYYGVFTYSMPDLNLKNPAVNEEIKKIVSFWLVDIGVDGFRLDGVRHYIEDGKIQVNTKETHQWVADFTAYVKSIKPNAVLVGEIWDGSEQVAAYLNKNELDMAFDFDLAESWVGSISSGDGRGIAFTQKYDNDLFKNANYATFLTNHDMNRAMSQFAGDIKKARIASTLLLTSPGTPFIYYGEEIGMKGEKPDENIRLPMPWNSEKNAGFTTGIPWRPGNVDTGGINVAAQDADPASMLSIYRDLIRLRMSSPALSDGKFFSINTDSSNVIAYLRIATDDAYLVIANLDIKAIGNYRLSAESIPLKGSFKLIGVLGAKDGNFLDISEDGKFKDFQPYSELSPMSVSIFKLDQQN